MERLVCFLCILALTAGCGPEEALEARLLPLSGCKAVGDSIRAAAIEEMSRKLDAELDRYLGTSCDDLDPFSPPAGSGMWDCSGDPTKCSSSYGDADGEKQDDSSGASSYSKTNNQVAGVEEADLVKTDGSYLYLASDGGFRIIRAWPPETTEELVRVPIEGTPQRLFVLDDRALVYSSVGGGGQAACTYGYSCQFTGDGRPTKMTILDIRDRRSPRGVREVKLSGSFISARRIGRSIHTVVTAPGPKLPGSRYRPVGLGTCRDGRTLWEILTSFERLRRENTAAIMSADLGGWPTIVDTRPLGGEKRTENVLGGCGGFYRSSQASGDQLTTVLSLDIADDSAAAGASTIVSRPGAVFGSKQALYLSVPHERASSGWWYQSMSGQDEASTVHKFTLTSDPPAAAYAASGVVKGRVLSQFSMDEHDGYLRIATTSGHLPGPDVYSTLTVLQHRGEALVAAGAVDRLAPKEDIRSVRFAGDRAFIVTFKKTDPLFVLDLEDPEEPRVLAELKIPGFSTYMHMMDSGHLLTIGYDASDQGSFAWFTGVMLQIFDVTDPTSPTLTHKEVIGTRGSSSEALTNHLAFTYYAPKNLLALPMTVCEGDADAAATSGAYGTEMTFSGLMVYDVATGSGFKLRGKVDHKPSEDLSCHTWWTNAHSQVKRSIVMEDYVFSISEDLIKVNSLGDLAEDIVVLPLGAAP